MKHVRIIRSDVFEGSAWLEGAIVDVEADLADRLIEAGLAEEAGDGDGDGGNPQ